MEQTSEIYPGIQLSRGGKSRLRRTKTYGEQQQQHVDVSTHSSLHHGQQDIEPIPENYSRFVEKVLWLLEGKFQDVEQITYLVYQRNQRDCMKCTRNGMQAF